jgi:hypothetical protein
MLAPSCTINAVQQLRLVIFRAVDHQFNYSRLA